MKELEAQRVTRIALDQATREAQVCTRKAPSLSRSIVVSICGVIACLALVFLMAAPPGLLA